MSTNFLAYNVKNNNRIFTCENSYAPDDMSPESDAEDACSHLMVAGICLPNPTQLACYGWRVFTLSGHQMANERGCLGYAADINSEMATYMAIMKALEWVNKNIHHTFFVGIVCDNEVIVNQINKLSVCNDEALKPLCEQAQALLEQAGSSLEVWPTERIQPAIDLARLAFGEAISQVEAHRYEY